MKDPKNSERFDELNKLHDRAVSRNKWFSRQAAEITKNYLGKLYYEHISSPYTKPFDYIRDSISVL